MQQLWKIMTDHGVLDVDLYEALFAHYEILIKQAYERGVDAGYSEKMNSDYDLTPPN